MKTRLAVAVLAVGDAEFWNQSRHPLRLLPPLDLLLRFAALDPILHLVLACGGGRLADGFCALSDETAAKKNTTKTLASTPFLMASVGESATPNKLI